MRMAKRGWLVIGGAVALAGAALLPALTAPQVVVNGERMRGVRVYTIRGRTMVPLREVIERIPGASVQWAPDQREIIVTDRGQHVVLHKGSRIAKVGGRDVSLDAPVVMRNGKALMPARFVEEVLGAKVDYDGAARRVSITAERNESRTMGYRRYPGGSRVEGEEVITFLHPGIYSSVQERSRRVNELLNDGLIQVAPEQGEPFDTRRVYLSWKDHNPVIMVGTVAVVSVTPDDAEKHNTTQKALARKWQKQVRHALSDIYGNAGADR